MAYMFKKTENGYEIKVEGQTIKSDRFSFYHEYPDGSVAFILDQRFHFHYQGSSEDIMELEKVSNPTGGCYKMDEQKLKIPSGPNRELVITFHENGTRSQKYE